MRRKRSDFEWAWAFLAPIQALHGAVDVIPGSQCRRMLLLLRLYRLSCRMSEHVYKSYVFVAQLRVQQIPPSKQVTSSFACMAKVK